MAVQLSRRQLIGLGAGGVVAAITAGLVSSRVGSTVSTGALPRSAEEFFKPIIRHDGMPHTSAVTEYVANSFGIGTVSSTLCAATPGGGISNGIVDTLNNVRLELTFVDESVVKPNTTFREFWGPKTSDSYEEAESYPWLDGYICQLTTFGTVYDVGLPDEYVFLVIPQMANGIEFDISDVDVAADNNQAMMFDGVTWDSDTGLVRVAKSNFEGDVWGGMRAQVMIRTSLDFLGQDFGVPTTVTCEMDGVSLADNHDIAFSNGLDGVLVMNLVNSDCASKVSREDIEIYFAGMEKRLDVLLPDDFVVYDSQTGSLMLCINALACPGIDVVIRPHEDNQSATLSAASEVLGTVFAPKVARADFTGYTYDGYVQTRNSGGSALADVTFDLNVIQNGKFWPYGYLEYEPWLDGAVNKLFKYFGYAINYLSNDNGAFQVVRNVMHGRFAEISQASYVFPVICFMYDYNFAVNTLGLPAYYPGADNKPMEGTRHITNVADSSLDEIWHYLENHYYQGVSWNNIPGEHYTQYARALSLPGCGDAWDYGRTYQFVDGSGPCGDAHFWSSIYNFEVADSTREDYDPNYDKRYGEPGYNPAYNSAVIAAAACSHIEDESWLEGKTTDDDYAGNIYGRILQINKTGRNPYIIIGFTSPQVGVNSQACQVVLKFHLRITGYATLEKGITL